MADGDAHTGDEAQAAAGALGDHAEADSAVTAATESHEPPPSLAARYDAWLARLAKRDPTRFIDDVFARPSVGPTAAWLIGGLLALVTAITYFYAPEAWDRPPDLDCTANPGAPGCIRPEAGVWTIIGVSALTLIAGLGPVFVRHVPLHWTGAFGQWLARQPHWRQAPMVGLAALIKLAYFLPALALSVIDYVFARMLGWLAGAKLQPWPVRYGALIAWMAALMPAAWFLPPPWGLIAAGVGMALVFAITRRWSWVERDREAFFVARKARPDQERIGFAEDLRDEALVALVFLFALMPLMLRQIEWWHEGTFEGGRAHFGDVMVWLGFFGAELAKSVPFVDWSEVFHAENGAPIKPGSFVGSVAVFTTRAVLDVLLIAAVVQAIQLAARLNEQNHAFNEGAVNVLEPFGEKRRLRQLHAATCDTPPDQIADHPVLTAFPTYSPERLVQIIRGGDRAHAVQAEADEPSREAVTSLSFAQLGPGGAARAAGPFVIGPKSRLAALADFAATGGVVSTMIPVPAGDFPIVPSQDDDTTAPEEPVSIPSFMLVRYQITFAQFDAFCLNAGFVQPDDQGWGRGDRPVINVSWNDICDRERGYLAWLNDLLGLTGQPDAFRLPSETEWEYACRAGTTTAYSFGDDENQLGDYAWFNGNSDGQTHPVGQKKPNPFGLYDMHGNVWEWCQDAWSDQYAPTPGGVAFDAEDSTARVRRGGSWIGSPPYLRSAYRSGDDAVNRGINGVGFRLARTILR